MTIKFKCKQCGKTEAHQTEREAFMDGWFIEGMELRNAVIPKGIEICYDCGIRPFDYKK